MKAALAANSSKRQRFENITDNSALKLIFQPPLPPGEYYLEQSAPRGMVGWWSLKTDTMAQGHAVRDGVLLDTDRSLILAEKSTSDIANFFTFRKPMPDMFQGPSAHNQWSWLEVFPQHVFASDDDPKEMMSVGIAQNAIDGKVGVMSNPRSRGRSFHNGAQPPRGKTGLSRL